MLFEWNPRAGKLILQWSSVGTDILVYDLYVIFLLHSRVTVVHSSKYLYVENALETLLTYIFHTGFKSRQACPVTVISGIRSPLTSNPLSTPVTGAACISQLTTGESCLNALSSLARCVLFFTQQPYGLLKSYYHRAQNPARISPHTFFPASSRYNWHITFSMFKIYGVLVSYT